MFRAIKNIRPIRSWLDFSATDKLLSIITYLVIALFLIFLHLSLIGKIGFLIVQSGSMKPYMPLGSFVVFRSSSMQKINVGDVIVFKDGKSSNILISHRVIRKLSNNNKPYLITKGDNNKIKDSASVDENMLVGKVVFVIPLLGWIMHFIKTPVGLLTLNFLLLIILAFIIMDKLKESIRKPIEQDILRVVFENSDDIGIQKSPLLEELRKIYLKEKN